MVPGHDPIGRLTRTVEISFIVLALGLLVANVVRAVTAGVLLHWWTPLVLVVAAFAADVAMLNTPILAAAIMMPVATDAGAAVALTLTAFAATSLPTNQVHQWAHMPAPPAAIEWLQRWSIILSRADHERHHQEPYVANYCIATGWCNRWLSAVGFFPACERVITRCFGIEPRAEERTFQARARSVRLQPDEQIQDIA